MCFLHRYRLRCYMLFKQYHVLHLCEGAAIALGASPDLALALHQVAAVPVEVRHVLRALFSKMLCL